jgi:hypothetical protein
MEREQQMQGSGAMQGGAEPFLIGPRPAGVTTHSFFVSVQMHTRMRINTTPILTMLMFFLFSCSLVFTPCPVWPGQSGVQDIHSPMPRT